MKKYPSRGKLIQNINLGGIAMERKINYEVPSIAKNKHLRQDVLSIEVQEPIIKSRSFKERIIDSIFEDKGVRSALKMLSEV